MLINTKGQIGNKMCCLKTFGMPIINSEQINKKQIDHFLFVKQVKCIKLRQRQDISPQGTTVWWLHTYIKIKWSQFLVIVTNKQTKYARSVWQQRLGACKYLWHEGQVTHEQG